MLTERAIKLCTELKEECLAGRILMCQWPHSIVCSILFQFQRRWC